MLEEQELRDYTVDDVIAALRTGQAMDDETISLLPYEQGILSWVMETEVEDESVITVTPQDITLLADKMDWLHRYNHEFVLACDITVEVFMLLMGKTRLIEEDSYDLQVYILPVLEEGQAPYTTEQVEAHTHLTQEESAALEEDCWQAIMAAKETKGTVRWAFAIIGAKANIVPKEDGESVFIDCDVSEHVLSDGAVAELSILSVDFSRKADGDNSDDGDAVSAMLELFAQRSALLRLQNPVVESSDVSAPADQEEVPA